MFFIYINIFFIYFVCKNSSQSNFNQTYFLKTVIKNIFLIYIFIYATSKTTAPSVELPVSFSHKFLLLHVCHY